MAAHDIRRHEAIFGCHMQPNKLTVKVARRIPTGESLLIAGGATPATPAQWRRTGLWVSTSGSAKFA